MSIKSNLNYLNFLKKSGVNSFIQNVPNKYSLYNNKLLNNSTKNRSIEQIATLKELESFVNNYEECKLKKEAKKTVFADGNAESKIMFIGEAPGAEEDKIGKPFVGVAGQLLDKMLNSINLNRSSVYITNIINWRPPNNRVPNSDEILQCLPLIQRHIEIVNPYIIILLGNTAAKAILATTLGITKLRGKWYDYKSISLKNVIPTIAMYHPSYLLRSPDQKKYAWEDLKEIQKKNETFK